MGYEVIEATYRFLHQTPNQVIDHLVNDSLSFC